MPRPVIYVAHPLGSGPDREQNRQNAARWCAWVAESSAAPVADWIVLSGVWTEDKRALGLEVDFALIERCHAVVLVGGRVSPGMQLEADHGEEHDVPAIDLTDMGEEPPSEPGLIEFLDGAIHISYRGGRVAAGMAELKEPNE